VRFQGSSSVTKFGNTYPFKLEEINITHDGISDLLMRYPNVEYIGSRENSWERKLTLVSFGIPENSRHLRDRLRYILKMLSFGRVSRSLYISPYVSVHEITGILRSAKVNLLEDEEDASPGRKKPWVFVFQARLEDLIATRRLIISNFWDLEKPADLYEKALALWEADNTKTEVLYQKCLSKILEAIVLDPFLPRELLPPGWVGTRALEVARELLTGLN
jgi:phenylacetic acid degradation operon negative regulatory protein